MLELRYMASDFSAVEVLTRAASVAEKLHTSGDPEAVLANAYTALGRELPQGAEPLPVRIVQLVLDAGDDLQRLNDHLRSLEGPLSEQQSSNRPEPEEELAPIDEEAQRFVEMWQNDQLGPGYSLFYRGTGYGRWLRSDWYFPPFRIMEQLPVQWFDGLMIVRRNGQDLPACEAIPPQEGDEVRWEHGLPNKVRGLINDYVEVATLFEIEAGEHDLWDVAEICLAFAEKYEELLGEYLWEDLWIEDLIYYPDHQLIYPSLGT